MALQTTAFARQWVSTDNPNIYEGNNNTAKEEGRFLCGPFRNWK
jgi:hypothetical protein